MPANDGFEEAVLGRILADLDGMVDAAAGSMGMPPGGKQYTQAEIDNEWNYSPIADPTSRVQTMLGLKAQGRTDEEITDMVYPNRRRLITTGRPRVADQISFAKQQTRRMSKLMAEYEQQMAQVAPLDQPAGTQGQWVGADGSAPAPMMSPPAPPLPDPAPIPPPTPAEIVPSDSRGMLDMPAMSMLGG